MSEHNLLVFPGAGRCAQWRHAIRSARNRGEADLAALAVVDDLEDALIYIEELEAELESQPRCSHTPWENP